jgi:cytoskeletal protein RodZ
MSDIGSTLREARMRARIDISEVEARTKIRAKYLRAIENEEWDLLPGPVYVKSFLRTYGDFLGLDSRMLIDDYKRRYERPTDHELRPIQALGRERDRGSRRPSLPPWVAVVAVLAAVVIALAVLGSSGGGNKTPAVTTPTARAHTHHRHHRATTTATTTTLPVLPATVKLQLTPTGTVYVCLVDGTGKKLINEQTFAVGQTIPAESAPKLLLTLGNASVTMKVNGRAVPVTPSSSAIRLELTPTGQHSIPDTTKPTCP